MRVIFIIILPLLISAAVFLATQKFFPVKDRTIKHEDFTKRIKSFWSILIFLLSFIMTISISLIYETSQKFGILAKNIEDKYEQINKNIDNVSKKSEFQELFNLYVAISNPKIKEYAMKEIESMKNDFRQEKVDISTYSSPNHVANLYDIAERYLIATNVGDITFFLHHDKYKKKNQLMYEKGIPIIRFLIYTGNDENFEDFKEEALKVHNELNTVCSIVVSPNDVKNSEKMRDILIIDGEILSETKMLHSGKHTDEASLTCNDYEIREAYKYFGILYNSVNKVEKNNTIYFMDDQKVKNKYGEYLKTNDIKTNKDLAKAILEKAIYEK